MAAKTAKNVDNGKQSKIVNVKESVVLTLDDLRPNERNPRKISDSAASGLRSSIGRFGDISGIVFNQKTNRLVCGHQRLQRLREMFGDDLSMVQYEGKNGERVYEILTPATDEHQNGMRYPVRVVDWPEIKEAEANIAANNPHIAGVFDMDLLTPMLLDIQELDPGAFADLALCELNDGSLPTMNSDTNGEKNEGGENPFAEKTTITIRCNNPDVAYSIMGYLEEIGVEVNNFSIDGAKFLECTARAK